MEHRDEGFHELPAFLVERFAVLAELEIEDFEQGKIDVVLLEQAVALFEGFVIEDEMFQIGVVELGNHRVEELAPQFAAPVNHFLVLRADHDKGDAPHVLGHAFVFLLVELERFSLPSLLDEVHLGFGIARFVQAIEGKVILSVADVVAVGRTEIALGKGKVMNRVQEVGLAAAVVAHKAVNPGAEVELGLGIVLEVAQIEVFQVHGGKVLEGFRFRAGLFGIVRCRDRLSDLFRCRAFFYSMTGLGNGGARCAFWVWGHRGMGFAPSGIGWLGTELVDMPGYILHQPHRGGGGAADTDPCKAVPALGIEEISGLEFVGAADKEGVGIVAAADGIEVFAVGTLLAAHKDDGILLEGERPELPGALAHALADAVHRLEFHLVLLALGGDVPGYFGVLFGIHRGLGKEHGGLGEVELFHFLQGSDHDGAVAGLAVEPDDFGMPGLAENQHLAALGLHLLETGLDALLELEHNGAGGIDQLDTVLLGNLVGGRGFAMGADQDFGILELAELFHVDDPESQGFEPLDFLGVVDDFAQAVEGGGVMQRGIVLIVGCMAIGWVAWAGAVFRLPTGVSIGKLAFGFGYGANHAETKAGMGIYRDNGHGFKWFRWMCRACGLRAAARKMPKESIRDENRTRCV